MDGDGGKAAAARLARERSHREFDRWWSVYPLKHGKAHARAKWDRERCVEIADLIIADTCKRAERHASWLEGYVHNPATYLHQRLWEDEVDESEPSVASLGRHAERMREAREARIAQLCEGLLGFGAFTSAAAGDDTGEIYEGECAPEAWADTARAC
jgi:hypothetical protein